MNENAVTRACAWLSLALMTYAPLAAAQTMEIFAGGGKFVDIPGNTIGLQATGLAAASDGFVYVRDLNGRLMRIDSATGLVTALPATPGGIAYNVEYGYTLAVDFSGRPLVSANGHLKRIEADGTLTDLGTFYYNGNAAVGPDGSVYVAGGSNQVRVWHSAADSGVFAGQEAAGFSGDGGPAVNAQFNDVEGLAVARNGDIYVADAQNHRIRRISAADGVVSTFAGTGSTGPTTFGTFRDQTAIYTPTRLAFDSAGNLYVSTFSGGLILRIDAVSGLVSKVGGGGTAGDGGLATNAALVPRELTVDGDGNVYFADWRDQYQKVRKISAATGIVSLAVGYNNYTFCGENIPARQICMGQTVGLDFDPSGNLFLTDPYYASIRKIAMGSTVLSTWKTTTEAGIGIEHDAAGNFYVASYGGYQINRYDAVTGAKTVVAGGHGYGYGGDGGPATLASFAAPVDVAVDGAGNLYIADAGNNLIRKVTAATGIITKLASIYSPSVVELESSGTLLANGSCSIHRIDTVSGASTRIAGTGSCGYLDPPGGTAAASTQLPDYMTFAVAPDGNLYLTWRTSHVYKVDVATGILTRVTTGTGLVTPEGVRVRLPSRMEFDAAGNLYISQSAFPDNYIFRISGLLDSTPPTIEPIINGVAGPGGWYRSDVQVNWVVSDGESAVTSTTGCANGSVTADTSGVTFTCSATSLGGTTSRSVTIRRDTIAPTLQFAAALPAADADGWNQTDVEISFDAQDALAGVYSTSVANPIRFSADGANQARDVVVTDRAGNTATFTTPTISIDKSAPVVEEHVSGTAGANGWYVGNVQVTWSVSDGGSPVTASDGCGASTVSSDTAGTTFTCTATSHGGATSRSVTLKRDATAPTIVFGALSPAPGPNGWNGGDVSVGFEASDATSGVQSTSLPSPLVFSGNGAGQVLAVEVTDNAGNTAQFQSPTVNIDRSPPTVQALINGTLGNNGWYTSDVSVSWAIGEDAGSILSQSGCDAASVTTDTAGLAFNCTVISSGGSASGSVTIKRDATPPTLSWGSFSPAPNTSGWNKTNVTVPFTRTDALSGVASTSATSPLVMSTEGANVTGQVTVVDNAGNSQIFVTAPRNIDKTAPVVTIASPANGASYGFYQDVISGFECADASLVSCTGTTAEGAFVNTKTAGARTYKVTAKDSVAFTTSVTNTYNVASTFNFDGFLGAAPSPAPNIVRKGSLVPLRWRLPDGNGGYVTSTASYSSIATTTVSCPAGAVAYDGTTTGSSGIGFDAATNVFTYNWQSSASFTGCKQIFITLKDGTQQDLVFKFQ